MSICRTTFHNISVGRIVVDRSDVFVISIGLYCYLSDYLVYYICDMPTNVVDVCYEFVIWNDISVEMYLQCVITVYVILIYFIQLFINLMCLEQGITVHVIRIHFMHSFIKLVLRNH